jgi:anaerobic magnesium-protoporphyrin IX monomethyl ester cyclase
LSGRRWRIRSVTGVIEEMIQLNARYGLTDFHFEDDNLTIRPDWILDFSRTLIDLGSPFTWQVTVGGSPKHLTAEVIEQMRRAGLTNMTFAPESGSHRVLTELMQKADERIEITRCTRLARKAGIAVCLFYVMGLPGETLGDIGRTILSAASLAIRGAREVSISLFIPLPGSRLFDDLFGDRDFDWDDPFFAAMVGQSDLSGSLSWNHEIAPRILTTGRILGMVLFYLTAWLTHPLDLIRLLRNLAIGRAETKTERILTGKIRFLVARFQRRPSNLSQRRQDAKEANKMLRE